MSWTHVVVLWNFYLFKDLKMGYKSNIVIAFNQSMEAIALKPNYREINQLYLQVYYQVNKSHTITYEHDELVNIAKQVKNNISVRKMELTTSKRISKLKA